MSEEHVWPERYASDYLKRLERMNKAEFMKLYQQEWPLTEPEHREFMGCKFAVDPSLPDDTAVVQTGKETKVFRFE